MSRFSDDGPDDLDSLLAYGRWVGRRKAVLNGRPGLLALQSLERALLALPHKRLIEGGLCDGKGVCANGAWLYRHFVDNEGMTPKAAWKRLQSEGRSRPTLFGEYNSWEELQRTGDLVSRHLQTTRTMAEVVAYENDEGVGYGGWSDKDQERRYQRVLVWVQERIRLHPATLAGASVVLDALRIPVAEVVG